MKPKYVDQLLADIPFIREWCESVVARVAYRSSGMIRPSDAPSYSNNPTLDAVIALENNHAYQYARRLLRHIDKLPRPARTFLYWRYWAEEPVTIEKAARRAGISESTAKSLLERLRREISELFPSHPLDRA